MRNMKWVGFIASALLVIACFFPWVIIDSRNITVSGIDSSGTNFGKPGYFHLFLTIFYLAFTFIPKLWTKRTNLLVGALNLGWAIRNYFVISSCQGGECPEKQIAIYIMLASSVAMLIATFFPDMKLPAQKK